MDDAKNDRRLNWQQACAVLGCSRSHFYNLVNSGRIRRFTVVRSRGCAFSKRIVWRGFLRIRALKIIYNYSTKNLFLTE